MRKIKKILINTLILIIFIIVIFTFLEILVRLLHFHDRFDKNDPLIKFTQFSNNSKIAYELKPDVEGYIYDKPVYINSNGERGKLYPINKSENTLRMIFIGDSITFGYGVSLNESYPYIIEDKLNKILTKKVESINLAVYAYNTVQQVETLKEKGLKYNPDIVIVGFYIANPEGNYTRLMTEKDSLHIFLDKLPQFILKGIKNSELIYIVYDSFSNLKNIFKKNKDPLIEIYNKSVDNWKTFENSINQLESLSKQYNFKVIFVIHPQLYNFEEHKFKYYHNLIKEEIGNKFVVIDMADYYKLYSDKELKVVIQDNVHPNYLGNKIIAEAIINQIK